MRIYYPLISVLAAILLLLLPVVILLGSSKENDPPQSEDDSSSISQDEIQRLKQELTLVTSKLSDLEKAKSGPATSHEPSDPKNPASGRRMQSAPFSPVGVKQHESTAAAVPDFQRIEDRIDELNKQLAGLIAVQQSSAAKAANEATVESEKAALPDVAKLAEPISPTTEKDPHPGLREMTAESGAKTEPEASEVLTASALNKEAKMNLRDRMAKDPDHKPVDAEPAINLVEVLLQRPVDGMTVNRVEQLYAQTTAPGWPVVLVRSSFDDEEWWAQPISGRRGTQITARVHFGNEGTPHGSAFSMVILLLDGYEEAVRFRTARRFEQLPKGIRRSREFMFVLK